MSSKAIAARDGFTSFNEVEEFIRGFEDGTLPRSRWTHRAHVAMASWYLICHPYDEAVRRIREGISAYNISQGGQNTSTSGYHETITIFWARVLRARLAATKLEVPLHRLINGLADEFADGRHPFEYYSRERLMSEDARAAWTEPDIKPLP